MLPITRLTSWLLQNELTGKHVRKGEAAIALWSHALKGEIQVRRCTWVDQLHVVVYTVLRRVHAAIAACIIGVVAIICSARSSGAHHTGRVLRLRARARKRA